MWIPYLQLLLLAALSYASVDETLLVNAVGKEVVQATIEKIEVSCIFPKDKQLLRNLAYAESRDGQGGIGAGGIWRVPSGVFSRLQRNSALTQFTNLISSKFGINWDWVAYSELSKPLLSALAARLAVALYMRESVPSLNNYQNLDGPIPWRLDDHARIWKNAYQKSDTESSLLTQYRNAAQQVKATVCRSKNVDIVFVLDSSGSIGSNNFQIMKQFAVDVANGFEVGPTKAQFAAVSFSNGVEEYFNLNSFQTQQSVVNRLQQIRYANGGTDTGAGLKWLSSNILRESNGARRGIPKFAVVLTDGASNDPGVTAAEALYLRNNNNDLTVLSVAIAEYGISSGYAYELAEIASHPVCRNLYELRDFADLAQTFIMELKQRVCDESAQLTVQPTYTDPNTGQIVLPPPMTMTVSPGSYESACTFVPSTTHTTLKVTVKGGTLSMFVSFTQRKPTNINHDLRVKVSEGKRKQDIIIQRSTVEKYAATPIGSTVRVCLGFEDGSTIRNTDGVEFDVRAVQGVFLDCGANVSITRNQIYEDDGPGFLDGTAIGYPKGVKCTWRVAALPGYYFRVEFPFFNLANGNIDVESKEQQADSVCVHSLSGQRASEEPLCGREANKFVYEMEGPLEVIFQSRDAAGPGYGFNLRITPLRDFRSQ